MHRIVCCGVRSAACLIVVTAAVLCGATPSHAFDPFGWFSERLPEPTPATLPYVLTVDGLDRGIERIVRDAALLDRLANDPPPDGATLARRAEADLPRIVDALWANGYYAAQVTVTVAGQPMTISQPATDRAAGSADRFRGRALVPVAIAVVAGPQYRFGSVALRDARSGGPLVDDIPARVRGLDPGEPARTAAVLAASARVANWYRDRGHPFVKVEPSRPVVDHPGQRLDLDLVVAPGPVASLGPVSVSGAPGVDPAVIRSFIYTEPGDPYSPAALAAIRKSVSRVEAIGSVKVVEATALDAQGRLPLMVEVTERPRRLLGASARYSTTDGPAIRGTFQHRNLFGGAESLRFDAELFAATLTRGERANRDFSIDDLGGRLRVAFFKPALGGTRNDLLVNVLTERERVDAFTSRLSNATVAVRHRFTDSFSIQGGIEGEVGQSSDSRGQVTYSLVGLPLGLTYDSTDKPLDPTRGFRITATAAPYLGFKDAPPRFGIGRVTGSTYVALDEDGWTVLAGRLSLGSVVGGDLDQIPSARRFYAGGGGSVRGFSYKSLGPRDALGRATGGLSIFEASAEARIRIDETIGIVPFVDAGTAFSGRAFNGGEKMRFAVGLGLRYFTPIGPIRVDVATPLQRTRKERPVALYVSIGQAF
jgi:translocation and assembly module TamA